VFPAICPAGPARLIAREFLSTTIFAVSEQQSLGVLRRSFSLGVLICAVEGAQRPFCVRFRHRAVDALAPLTGPVSFSSGPPWAYRIEYSTPSVGQPDSGHKFDACFRDRVEVIGELSRSWFLPITLSQMLPNRLYRMVSADGSLNGCGPTAVSGQPPLCPRERFRSSFAFCRISHLARTRTPPTSPPPQINGALSGRMPNANESVTTRSVWPTPEHDGNTANTLRKRSLASNERGGSEPLVRNESIRRLQRTNQPRANATNANPRSVTLSNAIITSCRGWAVAVTLAESDTEPPLQPSCQAIDIASFFRRLRSLAARPRLPPACVPRPVDGSPLLAGADDRQ